MHLDFVSVENRLVLEVGRFCLGPYFRYVVYYGIRRVGENFYGEGEREVKESESYFSALN